MNLLEITRNALDFTLRLDAALATGDLDLCGEILEMRGKAMAAFEAAHRAASVQEKQACRDEIRALAAADRSLREKTAADLADIARDFRENMVSNRQTAGQGYQTAPAQACIDRKA